MDWQDPVSPSPKLNGMEMEGRGLGVEGGRGGENLTGIVRVRVWALAAEHPSSVGQLERQIITKAGRGVWSMWSCWEEEQGSAVTPQAHSQGPDRARVCAAKQHWSLCGPAHHCPVGSHLQPVLWVV